MRGRKGKVRKKIDEKFKKNFLIAYVRSDSLIKRVSQELTQVI